MGLPLTIGVWAYVILDISDRYIIERFLDIDSVGIYDIGYKMSTLPVIISVGYKQVWSPMFFENMKSKNYSIISKLATYFILLFSSGCGIFILFSEELVRLLINQRFYGSIPIIPWITFGIFFLGILSTFASILEFKKKFFTIGIVSFVAAAINIILNLFLIKQFNIQGAAMATFLAYLAYFIIIIILTRKSLFLLFDVKRLLVSGAFLLLSFLYIIIFSKNLVIIKMLLIISWISFVMFSNFFFSQSDKKQAKLYAFNLYNKFLGKKNTL